MKCVRCNNWIGDATTPTAPIPGVVCGRCREESRMRRHNYATVVVIVACVLVYVGLAIRDSLCRSPRATPPVQPLSDKGVSV